MISAEIASKLTITKKNLQFPEKHNLAIVQFCVQ